MERELQRQEKIRRKKELKYPKGTKLLNEEERKKNFSKFDKNTKRIEPLLMYFFICIIFIIIIRVTFINFFIKIIFIICYICAFAGVKTIINTSIIFFPIIFVI